MRRSVMMGAMAKLHITEERVEKLGRVIRQTGTAIKSGEPLSAVITNLTGHPDLDNNNENSSSDSDNDADTEGKNSEQHNNEFIDIHPFLDMAMAAYDDENMAGKFPFVQRSQLIKDVQDPSVLRKNITTDTEVHVCVLEDGSLAFAFRGSEFQFKDPQSLISDFVTDMTKTQIPVELYNASDRVEYQADPHVKAHRGFQLAFRDVTRTPRHNENIRLVAEGLGAHTPYVRRVICIGHSLGGALATLCAQWCRYVAYPRAQVWCVTIGSPRVGNRAFARDFNSNVVTKGRSYRVVNKGDIVPNIPRFDKIMNVSSVYKHVIGFIYLKEHPTSKNIITVKRGGRRRNLHIWSFKDHMCNSYRESVNMVLATVSHVYQHKLYILPPLDPEERH